MKDVQPHAAQEAYGSRMSRGQWRSSLEIFCQNLQQIEGNLAIRACSKCTKWDAALGVLGIMLREAVHDVISFNSAMRALQTRWRKVVLQLYSLPGA